MGLFCDNIYIPFLLSAKFYYRVRSKKLRGILISPRRTRSKDSETAQEDRNKLPLLGCVYCIVVFLWLLSELIIVLLFLILNISKSNFVLSPFMNILKDRKTLFGNVVKKCIQCSRTSEKRNNIVKKFKYSASYFELYTKFTPNEKDFRCGFQISYEP